MRTTVLIGGHIDVSRLAALSQAIHRFPIKQSEGFYMLRGIMCPSVDRAIRLMGYCDDGRLPDGFIEKLQQIDACFRIHVWPSKRAAGRMMQRFRPDDSVDVTEADDFGALLRAHTADELVARGIDAREFLLRFAKPIPPVRVAP